MRKITTPSIVGIITIIIATFIINNIVMKGATMGGSSISKEQTFNARFNPDNFYWESFPYSLMAGIVIGIIAFAITYFLTPKKIQK